MVENINRLIDKYKDTEVYPLLQKYYINGSLDEKSLTVFSENVKEIIFSYSLSKYPYHEYVGKDKQDQLSLALSCYYNLEQKVRIKDGKLKIYPIDLSKRQLGQIYSSHLKEMVNFQFESGMDMDEIIDEVTDNVNKSYEELKNELTQMEMEPFYGSPKYLIGRADFIKKCISEIPGVYLNVDELIDKMHRFEEKYMKNDEDNLSEAIKGVGDEFFDDYDVLEECYKSLVAIEDELSPIVIKFWNQYLTDPNQHDDNSYRYIMHSFSGGLVEPDVMNKACCALNTDELVVAPYGNTGLIYSVDVNSVETFCSDDAGSWNCDKRTFIERGCPARWQLTNPKGISVFYEFCENSKLLMPETLERQCKGNNIKFNGEMLNKHRATLYSEIYLNKNARPVGAFYTDDCTNYEEIAIYAQKYNLPLINISLTKQRELKGLDPLESLSKH